MLRGEYQRDPLGLHEGGVRVKCTCGAKVNSKLNFCPECGKPHRRCGDPDAIAAPPVCGGCGATLTAGVKFCPKCGAKHEAAAMIAEAPSSAFGRLKSGASGFLKRPLATCADNSPFPSQAVSAARRGVDVLFTPARPFGGARRWRLCAVNCAILDRCRIYLVSDLPASSSARPGPLRVALLPDIRSSHLFRSGRVRNTARAVRHPPASAENSATPNLPANRRGSADRAAAPGVPPGCGALPGRRPVPSAARRAQIAGSPEPIAASKERIARSTAAFPMTTVSGRHRASRRIKCCLP